MQPSNAQVAAGYLIYGTSTILVYTSGNGVNGFTFDPGIGSFFLSHPDIQIPKIGKIYSVNDGNYIHYTGGVKKLIRWMQEIDEAEGRPFTSRYTGSLVADFYRNMLLGGIYFYPEGTTAPKGKLRFLYECNPIAFITEQAGGICTNGSERIMNLKPTELHQRVSFFCGSENLMLQANSFLN